MSEVKKIRGQLRRAFEGEAWHGPSVKELLAGVTAEQAAAKPLPKAHSIWELALHISAWEKIVHRRLAGEIVEATAEDDWPPVRDTSEEAWDRTLQEIEQAHLALREAVAQLDEARLEEIAPGTNYSVYFMLHGVIQHDLYHAGQIALLKRANP